VQKGMLCILIFMLIIASAVIPISATILSEKSYRSLIRENGNTMNVDASNVNMNSSTAIFIGLIKNMNKSSNNYISFDCIIVYYRAYVNGHLIYATILPNGFDIDVNFDTKIGIVTKHVIFVAFTMHDI
jgi:hypothetical protein